MVVFTSSEWEVHHIHQDCMNTADRLDYADPCSPEENKTTRWQHPLLVATLHLHTEATYYPAG